MRSLTITAAAAAATVALLASPGATHQPLISGPGIAVTGSAANPAQASCGDQSQQDGTAHQRAVSDISWFQGTLEEAFTHHPHAHADQRPLLHF
jgi:hypothetical protein